MDKDNNEEYEKANTKGKIIAITTLSIIGVIIIIIIIIVILVKSFFEDLSKNKYYVLNVNENNREQIILLLKQEDKKYCESIYKIEYTQLFPNDKSAKIYCTNENDITFGIYDNKPSELANYIRENGIVDMR